MNILENYISVYRNVYDRKGETMKMIDFLQGDYRRIVEAVRTCPDDTERKKLKSQLPCATISGVFAPTRTSVNLLMHSGAICIDIDEQDNPDRDFSKLKSTLCKLKAAAYVSYSASGKGLFLIMPIAYPEQHKEHFYAIERDFKGVGVVIDSQCKDVSRLRLASFDDNPYINPNAVAYTVTAQAPRAQGRRLVARHCVKHNGDIEKKVEYLVREVERLKLDLTQDYENWYKIGFALTHLENGRDLYHRLSCFNPKYTHWECDRKYSYLEGKARIGIDFFFDYLAEWGIELPDDF